MQKIKHLALLLLLLFTSRVAFANTAADQVTISPITLAPEGDQGFFTVSLQGNTAYTAYQMDIHMPDGVEIVTIEGQKMLFMAYDEYAFDGNDIYPFTSTKNPFTGKVTKTYTHTLQFESQQDGSMRVLCYSSASEVLTATSGALFHVIVKASTFAKPGLSEITLSNIRFSTPANELHRFDDTAIEAINVKGQCNLSLNISTSNKFSTCVSPFDIELPQGVEAYSCSSYSDEVLLLTRAAGIKAYTPYIVYAPNGYSGTFSGTPDEAAYNERVIDGKAESGFLTATLKQTELVADNGANNYYVLQRKDGTDAPMFYRVGTTSYILPAGRCYLTLPKSVATAVTLRFSDANGLPTVVMDNEQAEDAPMYNLQGQQILQPQPGQIYIQYGRKMIKNY